MIKVYKNNMAPFSLKRNKAYNGEDVKCQLLNDQHEKCYICERILCTDFEIEHLKNQKNYPELKYTWENLFISCKYCNDKKKFQFDNILNPKDCCIEDAIIQRIDYDKNKAIFLSAKNMSNVTNVNNNTIELLERIFNGSKKIRKKREEKFFEFFIRNLNNFYNLINKYLKNNESNLEQVIREELAIDKEFLGFKYWIIHDKPTLYEKFKKDIIWNK